MTRRRWIADTWNDATATLTGEAAAHLARVLRAQPGMEFDIVAGETVRRGVIASVSSESVHFTLGDHVAANPALPLTLLLAIFKFDRLEWAIEKATELGVQRIIPVIARRTEKHLAHAAAARVERWRRIAREAAQQSRRSDTLLIDNPITLKDAVREAPEAVRLLLAENERVTSLGDTLVDLATTNGHKEKSPQVRIAVGPEGGWTSEEEEMFAGAGWKPVSLGPRILRAETAAICAVSVASVLLE
jgi:16S rRNA (uracil1498-N3)-methyltransferase